MTAPRVERIEDHETALIAAFAGLQSSMWTAMPAQIIKVDLARMTVECQVTIQALIRAPDQSTSWATIPPLVDVPLVFPSGGGYTLTFPVAVGDECLVVLASRCIDSWWQLGGVQIPQDLRMHDLSDGFALVGPRNQARLISGISTTDVVLRNDAGTTAVALKPNGDIALTTPAAVTIAAASVNINANVAITGNLTNNGVNVGSTHTHSGVKSGPDTSGVPT